jgi:uncharacterized protein involved in outer membrane biogenesis
LSAKKALVAALCALVALAGLALFIPINSPGLGREVEERLRSSTGISLEISRSRFRLLRGLLLEDTVASASFIAGSYRVHVPRIHLEHRPLALLRGRLELTGIRLERPAVRLDLGQRSGARVFVRNAAALETAEASDPWLDVSLALEEVRIEGGDLVVRDRVSIEGLDLALTRVEYDRRALTPLHGLTSEGALAMGKIAFRGLALRDVAARTVTQAGRFELRGLRVASERGELSGDLALDFNSFPFRYRASLLGTAFELEGVGRGTLRLEAEGFGTRARDLKGKGSFAIEGGRFEDAPWIREIDPALAGAKHAPIEIPFDVRDERVFLQSFDIQAAEKTVAIEGSIGLDGSRDLRGSVENVTSR